MVWKVRLKQSTSVKGGHLADTSSSQNFARVILILPTFTYLEFSSFKRKNAEARNQDFEHEHFGHGATSVPPNHDRIIHGSTESSTDPRDARVPKMC